MCGSDSIPLLLCLQVAAPPALQKTRCALHLTAAHLTCLHSCMTFSLFFRILRLVFLFSFLRLLCDRGYVVISFTLPIRCMHPTHGPLQLLSSSGGCGHKTLRHSSIPGWSLMCKLNPPLSNHALMRCSLLVPAAEGRTTRQGPVSSGASLP